MEYVPDQQEDRLAEAVNRYDVHALLHQRLLQHAPDQPVLVHLALGEQEELLAHRTSPRASPWAHAHPPHPLLRSVVSEQESDLHETDWKRDS